MKNQETINNQLLQLRDKIDNIDEQIISLLTKRIGYVKEVGDLKHQLGSNLSFIRSGREASMLRNLTKKMQGTFPEEAIGTIWRAIIATSLHVEKPLKISAYSDELNNDCFWLAREYYGAFIPIEKNNNQENIVNLVENSQISVGILPANSKSNWWIRSENEKNDIYIFAKIPFIENSLNKFEPVFAIANVLPEKTDCDHSIIALNTNLKNNELLQTLQLINKEADIITQNNQDYLVQISGYLQNDHNIIEQIKNTAKCNSTPRYLGSYATTIKIK